MKATEHGMDFAHAGNILFTLRDAAVAARGQHDEPAAFKVVNRGDLVPDTVD